jgi:hypothetical protein
VSVHVPATCAGMVQAYTVAQPVPWFTLTRTKVSGSPLLNRPYCVRSPTSSVSSSTDR